MARLVLLSTLAACVGGPYTDSATSTGEGSSAGTTAAVTTGAATSGGTSTTGGPQPTTDAPPATSDGECIFHSECDPDGGLGVECSVWAQDCFPGEKCVPYGGSTVGTWDLTKCVPIGRDAGEPGEPCTVEGGPGSGDDDCGLGGVCLGATVEDPAGTCTALCKGSPNDPTCGEASVCVEFGSIDVCAPVCHPLENDCAAGQVCVPDPDDIGRFFCFLDASGEEGQEFDDCEYINSCDPGLLCANPALAVECDPGASGCCLKYCDVSLPDCTAMGAECLPFYGMDEPPLGLEDLGVCGIPQ